MQKIDIDVMIILFSYFKEHFGEASHAQSERTILITVCCKVTGHFFKMFRVYALKHLANFEWMTNEASTPIKFSEVIWDFFKYTNIKCKFISPACSSLIWYKKDELYT